MKKPNTFADNFLGAFKEALEQEPEEYDANDFYQLLIDYHVPLKFNNNGYISYTHLKDRIGGKKSFKQFLRTAHGMNAMEGFKEFKNQSMPFYVEEKKDIWLSACGAWEYALYSNVKLRRQYIRDMAEALKHMLSPQRILEEELVSMQKAGQDMTNVVSITGKKFDENT